MNDLVHPTGASYPAVYDALICNDCTPCWGWLNSNATDRNLTSALAANLSSTYETVIQHYSHQFTNFDMLYVDFDMDELIQEYVQQGGHAEDIIEPVDGFHASTLGHQLIAEAVWDYIVQNKPSWIPPTNPFNAQIEALFGDQGGY
jgi:acyloxyacyl hydrolase